MGSMRPSLLLPRLSEAKRLPSVYGPGGNRGKPGPLARRALSRRVRLSAILCGWPISRLQRPLRPPWSSWPSGRPNVAFPAAKGWWCSATCTWAAAAGGTISCPVPRAARGSAAALLPAGPLHPGAERGRGGAAALPPAADPASVGKLLRASGRVRPPGAPGAPGGQPRRGAGPAGRPRPAPRLLESLRLVRGRESLLLFHGHQASYLQTRFLGLVAVLLRYVANPLGIRNWTVSRSSRRRFRVERRVYAFARGRRQVVLIGHTHRPLFESLSKLDVLRFRIESLCRQIPTASGRRRASLERELTARKAELEQVLARRGRDPGKPLRLPAAGALPVQLRLLHRQARPHWTGDRRGRHRPGALV